MKQNTEKESPLYSTPVHPPVKHKTARGESDECALNLAYAHRRLMRDVLAVERRILPSWASRPVRERPGPPVVPQARKAAAILKAVLERYEPGSRLSRMHIILAANCRESEATWVRDWAKSQGRWPYEDASSNGRKGGGS